MCGRYTARRAAFYSAAFRATPLFEEFTERPRYNVAPSQQVPIVRLDHSGRRVLCMVRWGLIPYWTRGKPRAQPINARDDRLLESPMFKGALQRRRCLVPADGFYEWLDRKPAKVPYFFRLRSDEPFAFAGLWERWRPDESADPVETCVHITTSANEMVEPIHPRMPAILRPADYDRWLDPATPPAEAVKLLQPYPAEEMEGYVVSPRVNKADTEGPELIEPE